MEQRINRKSVKHRSIELLKAHWQMPVVSTLMYFIISFILAFTVIGSPLVAFGTLPVFAYFNALMFVRCESTKDFRIARLDFTSKCFWKVWGVQALVNLAPIGIVLIGVLISGLFFVIDPLLGEGLMIIFYLAGIFGIAYFTSPLIYLPYVVIETEGEIPMIQCIKICFFRYGKCKGEIIFLILSFIGWIMLSILTMGLLFLIIVPYMNASFYYSYLDLENTW